MAVATEVSTNQLNPAAVMPYGNSGAIDANLILDTAANPFSTNRDSAAIASVEGGVFAEIVFQCGTVTDSNEVITFTVNVSIDGTNYLVAFVTPQFTQAGMSGKSRAWSIYIPRGNTTTKLTKVKVTSSGVGGTTPSFPLDIFIRTVGLGADRGLENFF